MPEMHSVWLWMRSKRLPGGPVRTRMPFRSNCSQTRPRALCISNAGEHSPCDLAGAFSAAFWLAFVFCGCNQCAVFSQHGERRKGAVGRLSAGGKQILNFQFSLSLILNGGQDVR